MLSTNTIALAVTLWHIPAGAPHKLARLDLAPFLAVAVSDQPLSEAERSAVSHGSLAEVRKRVTALGWEVWEGDGYLAAVDPDLIGAAGRSDYIAAYKEIGRGAGDVRSFELLSPVLQDIVKREMGRVGHGASGSLAPGTKTNVAFEPFATLELTDGVRTIKLPLFHQPKPGRDDALIQGPPLGSDAAPKYPVHEHYPKPWYAPRSCHYAFSPSAEDPVQQADTMAWFWNRMADFEATWSKAASEAREAAFDSLSDGWILGAQAAEAHGASAEGMPQALRKEIADFLKRNHTSRGFDSEDEATLFFAKARVSRVRRGVNLVFCPDPGGKRAIGKHLLP
jgi:hypothetical protein